MSHVTFEIKAHSIRGVQVVEVWCDGEFCATITPGDPGKKTIRITSAHFKGDRGMDELPTSIVMAPLGILPIPIPMLQIDFDPQPYSIEGNKLVRSP